MDIWGSDVIDGSGRWVWVGEGEGEGGERQ